MNDTGTVTSQKLIFPNIDKSHYQGNRHRAILRTMLFSGLASVGLAFVLYYLLPYTHFSNEGLLVDSSIYALAIFMSILVFRYIGLLIASFFFLISITFKEKKPYEPFVSIIVPAYNEEKVLADSVSSLLQLDYPNYEIIIVNDGSTDRTKEVGEKLAGVRQGLHSDVVVTLINKPNGGKASALNAGILYSKAKYVLCMDGDSVLSPNTLKASMPHFRDPYVGAVAGNVKVVNRNRMITKLQALEYLEGLNMLRSAQSFLGLVNIIPGPIGIFRKKAIMKAGWYSGDTYAEDADITLKIRFAGWKVKYEIDAIAYTEAPETMHQLIKQRYRWTRGFLQSIRKHKIHLKPDAEGYPFKYLPGQLFAR